MKKFNFFKSVFSSIYQAIKSNPDVQKLAAKYPHFFKFFKQRLHWKNFWGLPLTFAVIIFIYILFLFIGLISEVLSSDLIIFTDINLANLLYEFRNPLLTQILFKFTLLGNLPILIASIILFSGILLLWEKRKYLFSFWIVMAGSALFEYLGKIIVHRPRPQNIAVFDLSSSAFPSGHATFSLALYGFIAYFLFKQIKKWTYKIIVVAVLLIIILIIGFSRLYLGFHFLSDVLGGYLLGLLWLIIGISLTEWFYLITQPEKKISSTFKLKTLTISFILIFAFIYIGYALWYNPELNLFKEEKIINLNSNNVLDLFGSQLNLSKYSETPTSKQQEPISLIIIAKDNGTLINAFAKAGWYLADSPTISAILKIGKAGLFNKEYLNAPVTPVFWSGLVNNFSFEKPTASQTVRSRHHTRFWNTNYQLPTGQQIFVGTASLDQGLKWLFTHNINPDLDTEREYIFQDLQNVGVIANFQKTKFVQAQLNKNFAGDYFFTDGQAYIIYLK